MTSIPLISLVLVAMMVPTASAQGGISSCCLKYTGTKVHRESLRSYYQEDKSSCNPPAVVFTTIHSIRICASPFNMWTKTSMAFLDGKNYGQQQSRSKRQPNKNKLH
ncbi:C-C motif chemokine 4-like [Poeciliopsis prolifica]|uniref:CCL2 n=1 Tax=Poeciliopsis prolifica TaxID=188132 RepID=A0A0S7ERQ8_9TELE|nr:C-C motif chemokine 4-like [Poeciliopsis prolifica]